LEPKPGDDYFAKFEPLKAPSTGGLYLHEGDRWPSLAIPSPNRNSIHASSRRI